VTQLIGEEPASKMLIPVPHVLEERRQLAHDLFQPATESLFAKMVDTMARLYSLSEGKDQRCSSHEGDITDQTNNAYTCTQLSLATVDKPVQSPNPVDLTLHLDGVNPLGEAKPWKSAKPTKLKLNPPSKITKTKKPPTSLTCLFCYGNPKRGRTQNLARSDNLRRHYRQVHFQYQVGPFLCPLPDCNKIIHDLDHFANHARLSR